MYIAAFEPIAPRVHIQDDGSIKYDEDKRTNARNVEEYIQLMSQGLNFNSGQARAIQHPHLQHDQYVKDEPFATTASDGHTTDEDIEVPRIGNVVSRCDGKGGTDLPRGDKYDTLKGSLQRQSRGDLESFQSVRIKSRQPLLNLKTYSAIDSSLRIYDEELTRDYFQALHELCTSGVSFAGQTCLVTGAGGGSIALDVVKALLEGGATVVATVWHRFSDTRAQTVHKLYKKAYEEHGSKHSRLICPPCNCASAQDVRSVVDYVMGDLGLDLDFVIPFSAASEVGRTISEIDGHSDMAHRMMLPCD